MIPGLPNIYIKFHKKHSEDCTPYSLKTISNRIKLKPIAKFIYLRNIGKAVTIVLLLDFHAAFTFGWRFFHSEFTWYKAKRIRFSNRNF